MTPTQWDDLKYFSPKENWGNPSKMRHSLLWRLDEARQRVGFPFIVTSGNQGKHHPNSLHYSGRAVDFVVKRPLNVALCDILFDLLRFDFTGVGIYPHWKPYGGFHVEHSSARKPVKRLWLGIYEKDDAGKQIQTYHAITVENLQKYGAFSKVTKRGKK